MKALVFGSDGKWVSMGVPATGDYGMGEGFFYSVPVVCEPGEFKRVGGVTLTPAVDAMMENERVALAHLLAQARRVLLQRLQLGREARVVIGRGAELVLGRLERGRAIGRIAREERVLALFTGHPARCSSSGRRSRSCC
jgi:hypothetical protein